MQQRQREVLGEDGQMRSDTAHPPPSHRHPDARMPARLQGWFVAAATATKQPVPALKRLGTRRPSGFAIAVAVISAWAVVANFLRLGSPVIGYDEPFYSIAAWR